MSKQLSQNIYCIGESENGPCKIGVCSNKRLRISTLQVGNPRKLEYFFFEKVENAAQKEKLLHRYFDKLNIRGEWFNLPITVVIEAINRAILGTLVVECEHEFDNRNQVIQIRVSPEEKKFIEDSAKSIGMNASSFLRKLMKEWKK